MSPGYLQLLGNGLLAERVQQANELFTHCTCYRKLSRTNVLKE